MEAHVKFYHVGDNSEARDVSLNLPTGQKKSKHMTLVKKVLRGLRDEGHMMYAYYVEPGAERPIKTVIDIYYNRDWIVPRAYEIMGNYRKGILTLRALHYRLVSKYGMLNTLQHYKRVTEAMAVERKGGRLDYDTFSDHERETVGYGRWEETVLAVEIETAKQAIGDWISNYVKNRWERQRFYIEVWIEKKALQGVFQPVCLNWGVLLAPCKGYPSLTFINEAIERMIEPRDSGRDCVILYFGDYDASGVDIPRSLQENFNQMGGDVRVVPCMLTEEQVIEMGLPPAPSKETDSRAASWDGLGQVELDAVEQRQLAGLVNEFIEEYFDSEIYEEVKADEETEQEEYRAQMIQFVTNYGQE